MSVDAEMHFQKMLAGGNKGSMQSGAPHQRASSMGITSRSDIAKNGSGNNDEAAPVDGNEDENEDYEDAPEGDDESFASSMGSQNVTPRDAAIAGIGSGSSSEEKQSVVVEPEGDSAK